LRQIKAANAGVVCTLNQASSNAGAMDDFRVTRISDGAVHEPYYGLLSLDQCLRETSSATHGMFCAHHDDRGYYPEAVKVSDIAFAFKVFTGEDPYEACLQWIAKN
jgi:hypothetical protein